MTFGQLRSELESDLTQHVGFPPAVSTAEQSQLLASTFKRLINDAFFGIPESARLLEEGDNQVEMVRHRLLYEASLAIQDLSAHLPSPICSIMRETAKTRIRLVLDGALQPKQMAA